MIKEHKSYKYAQSVINKEIPAPKYVIKQCKNFINICGGKSERYFIDEEKLNKIDNILKLLIMPRGLKTGQSIYDCSCGYQWLIYVALCVVYRENPRKRRYETVILEVGRKNFKTFTISTIFILLFLLEPKFSKFYSVAADEVGALPNSYAIEAMRSGQLNILNKLGCIISTKYPTANNPFEDEVNYAKKVLDGVQKDETVFSLLYEPDNTDDWTSDDTILKHANPAALEIPEIWEDLIKKRARRKNFSRRDVFYPRGANKREK